MSTTMTDPSILHLLYKLSTRGRYVETRCRLKITATRRPKPSFERKNKSGLETRRAASQDRLKIFALMGTCQENA